MKFIQKLAQMKGISNLTYALLTVPLLLIVATAIFSTFTSSIDRGDWSADANATYDDINDNTWSGFKLGALLPFVLIAVVVIGVVLGALAFRTG